MTVVERIIERSRHRFGRRIAERRPDEVVPVSVVMPARDAEDTVARAVESVLAQRSQRWELIVVDDGSTDGTVDLVEQVAGGDDRVSVVSGPGRGVSAARNTGTAAARFDHVLYLDADDRIASRFVASMGGALYDDPTLAGVRCIWAYETPDGRTQAWDDLDLTDLFAVAATRCPFAIHACVVRRDLVEAVGGFDPTLVVGEDWDLWQRIGRAGGRLAFVPEVMAYYLMRPSSVMHVDLRRSQRDLVEVTRRGTRPDERVKQPVPRHAAGIPIPPDIDIEAEALAGTLGVAIPADIELAPLLPDAPPDPSKAAYADHIAGTLHESVAFGACALLEDWPDLLVTHRDRIDEMLRLYTDWLNRPELYDEVLRALELTIAHSVDPDEVSVIGRTAVRRLDLAAPLQSIELDAGIEQFLAAVHHGRTPIGHVAVPILDRIVAPTDVASAVANELGPRLASRTATDPDLARRLLPRLADRAAARSTGRLLLDVSWDRHSGARATVEEFLRWQARRASASLLGVETGLGPAPTGEGSQAGTRSEEAHSGGDDIEVDNPDLRHFDDQYGEDYFDSIFEQDDPWHYSGNYEQTKYEQTLAAMGDRRFRRGLELACAEGHFTVQLAPRVDELIAADISPTALERAAQRCVDHDNIEFRAIDLRDGTLPGDLDLIVCSEVLYFMDSEESLTDLASRFAAALAPDGVVVMAHANLVVDDPDSTGFDWGHEFGAQRIGEIVASDPGLVAVATHVSELYRIHVLRKSSTDSSHADNRADRDQGPPPVEIPIPYADDLDPHIDRMALWGGATKTRAEAFETEVAYQLPILMYHRVAPSGVPALDEYRVTPEAFEEQLTHLRANGYYGIDFAHLRDAVRTHRPLPGRAVLITFDDGYQDFFDHAWPLLRDYDFPATVFAVTDLVGTTSSWDARYGEPAELMGWDELRHLRRNGIEIGSHTASHRSLTSMRSHEILAQERRCRDTLSEELGSDITAMAYPYGMYDQRVTSLLRQAGYDMAVTTQGWLATVWHDPMLLPRVDVAGHDGIDVFAAKLGRRGGLNPIRRGVREVRGLLDR